MNKDLNKQHIALIFSLYITQFLGFAYFTEAFIAILRQNGVTLENLGLVYMLGLFWVIRFLWAPLVDRFSIKRLGHYRGWIIIFQSLMVLLLALSSGYNLMSNIPTVVLFAALFAFFSASQDVALGALVLKTVSVKSRPTANALKSAGGMIGIILGSGVGLVLYTHLGWKYTMLIMAIVTAISLVQILFYTEPEKEEDGKQEKIDYKQYIDFWKGKEKKYWFLFLIIYPITISVAFGLVTPMLVDLKWALDKIGFYVHIVGFGLGVLASFGASKLIGMFGKKRILIVAASGQFVGILLLLFLAFGFDNTFIVMFVIGFIFAFYSPSQVVMTTLMMDKSSHKTPAAQITVQHGIYMFSGILFTGLSISLAGVFGYSAIIVSASLIGIIAIFGSIKIELEEKK